MMSRLLTPSVALDLEGSKVRVVTKEGDPWFVLADVCHALDLRDPSAVTKSLDKDEKGKNSIRTPGGPQNLIVVSESGLYTAQP